MSVMERTRVEQGFHNSEPRFFARVAQGVPGLRSLSISGLGSGPWRHGGGCRRRCRRRRCLRCHRRCCVERSEQKVAEISFWWETTKVCPLCSFCFVTSLDYLMCQLSWFAFVLKNQNLRGKRKNDGKTIIWLSNDLSFGCPLESQALLGSVFLTILIALGTVLQGSSFFRFVLHPLSNWL